MSKRNVEKWLDICKSLDGQQKYCFKDWADFWKRIVQEKTEKGENS